MHWHPGVGFCVPPPGFTHTAPWPKQMRRKRLSYTGTHCVSLLSCARVLARASALGSTTPLALCVRRARQGARVTTHPTAPSHSYKADWPIFGMNWSQKRNQPFRLAIGSFIEEYTNKVQFLELDEEAGKFKVHSTIDHPYPSTKIMWIPDLDDQRPDLVATTGDYLRIWRVGENKTKLECLLNNVGRVVTPPPQARSRPT